MFLSFFALFQDLNPGLLFLRVSPNALSTPLPSWVWPVLALICHTSPEPTHTTITPHAAPHPAKKQQCHCERSAAIHIRARHGLPRRASSQWQQSPRHRKQAFSREAGTAVVGSAAIHTRFSHCERSAAIHEIADNAL